MFDYLDGQGVTLDANMIKGDDSIEVMIDPSVSEGQDNNEIIEIIE